MKNGARLSRIIAFAFILSLLLAGCNHGAGTSSDTGQPSSKAGSSPSEPPVSGTESEEVQSDTSGTVSSKVQTGNADPLSGSFTYTGSVKPTSERDDAGEEKAPRNCSNLATPLTGFAEAEANALREEILNTGNTEDYYSIPGTKYYISPGGNNENSGTSASTAFRTTDALNGISLKEGDAVLFERNSIFRQLQPINAGKGVIYGSYGKGDKPKLFGSPMNFAKAVWKPSKKKNVWQTQYLYDEACNMVFDHGKGVGYKRENLRSLSENMYYCVDEELGLIYMYCDQGNPAKVYKSIEISPRTYSVVVPSGINNVVIDNLCMKYAGGGGVYLQSNNNGIVITNCEIGYTGGATLGSVRAGNGIGGWEGNKNCRWDHNWVYQTFDIAISPQGFGGAKCSYENISISNNLMEYNDGDIEFWDDGSTFKNFTMDNNIMRFTSLGWGTRINDAGVRGIEGCFVAHTQNANVINLSCRNNIFDCPGRQIINWSIALPQLAEMHISGTKVYVKASYRTTTQVIRYFRRSESDALSYDAANAEDLLDAMKKFDPSVIAGWYS